MVAELLTGGSVALEITHPALKEDTPAEFRKLCGPYDPVNILNIINYIIFQCLSCCHVVLKKYFSTLVLCGCLLVLVILSYANFMISIKTFNELFSQ